jgi:hypothetical protein
MRQQFFDFTLGIMQPRGSKVFEGQFSSGFRHSSRSSKGNRGKAEQGGEIRFLGSAVEALAYRKNLEAGFRAFSLLGVPKNPFGRQFVVFGGKAIDDLAAGGS